jgi:hypothetical protein
MMVRVITLPHGGETHLLTSSSSKGPQIVMVRVITFPHGGKTPPSYLHPVYTVCGALASTQ